MSFWKWSQTAASNSNADSSINWQEGQAPSSVNDSARGMMAAAAKYRDDVAGGIVTTGTSTAYSVTSFQSFDTLAHMHGAQIAFVPHATNTGSVTLNVDGLGAKPLRPTAGIETAAGVLIQGTPYVATYNNTNNEWYLHSFYGNPYNIPIGGLLPYCGTTAPNSNFVLPFGQAISRTTYAAAFALLSTTFGAGDGTTTFGVPDLRGRVAAGKDDMGGAAASRITSAGAGIVGTTLGAVGGAQSMSLTIDKLPSLPITASLTAPHYNSATNSSAPTQGGGSSVTVLVPPLTDATTTDGGVTASIAGTSGTGSGGAQTIVQPTILLNYIMRVI